MFCFCTNIQHRLPGAIIPLHHHSPRHYPAVAIPFTTPRNSVAMTSLDVSDNILRLEGAKHIAAALPECK